MDHQTRLEIVERLGERRPLTSDELFYIRQRYGHLSKSRWLVEAKRDSIAHTVIQRLLADVDRLNAAIANHQAAKQSYCHGEAEDTTLWGAISPDATFTDNPNFDYPA